MGKTGQSSRVSSYKGQMTPGPGAYFPKARPSSPSFSFGRKIVSNNPRSGEKMPGPAAYFPSMRASSPSFSLGKRCTSPVKASSGDLGPGAYFVKTQQNVGSPAYTLASKVTIGKEEDTTPGPGAYNAPTKQMGPKYSMLPKRKGDTSRDSLPGPGSYFVKDLSCSRASFFSSSSSSTRRR